MAMLDIIATLLELLLAAVNKGRGKQMVGFAPTKPPKQPMSDKRFKQISELVFDILLVSIVPMILLASGVMFSMMAK